MIYPCLAEMTGISLFLQHSNSIIMSEALTSSINNVLLNKELTGIEFFNINDKYWVFDEDKVWVLDSGIQLTFGNEVFSFAWDSEKQFYTHHFGPVSEISGELEFYPLEAMNIEGISALIGKKISSIDYKWNFYHDLDENFEPLEQKNYMPMEMLLSFDSGNVLQLAGIEFAVDLENNKISTASFDSTGNFLVTLDHKIDVEEHMEE
jgi:hypothetical protein